MKYLSLLIFLTFISGEIFSQVDSFRIGNSVFTVQCPQDWNLIDIKDSAQGTGKGVNALFRFAAFDDCNFSTIGVEFINQNLPAPKSRRSFRKNKKEPATTEFRHVNGWQFFYYSVSKPNKNKCHNDLVFSAYLHRVNDSLDLLIYLDCAVIPSERTKMESALQAFTEQFMTSNREQFHLLKSHMQIPPAADSIEVFGNSLHLGIPYGWKVTKRKSEDPEYPTGKRMVMQPLREEKEGAPASISINVEELDTTTLSSNQSYFDLQTSAVKKSTVQRSQSRLDSVSANVRNNGVDTLSNQTVVVTFINLEDETTVTFLQHYSFIVRHDEELYAIEFILSCSAMDALQIQYASEQFRILCEYVRVNNNFKKW